MTAEVNGPEALRVFDTNAIGLIRVTQAALPLLEKSENPVVVNVSSAAAPVGRGRTPSWSSTQAIIVSNRDC